ncbi:MAG: YjjG family noncanonical pyrimidine nucleotidase [Crocinitomicaceae bacterium]
MNDFHLFFDLDHTLWDFEKNSKSALKQIFKETGLDQKVEKFSTFHGVYQNANKLLWQQYGKGTINKELLRTKRFTDTLKYFKIEDDSLVETLSQAYLDVSPYQKNLFPGAIETLNNLANEGYNLHIITNGFKEVQHIKIREAGLKSFFDVIVCSEEVGVTKPNARVFQHSMELAKAKKDKSVMIGDNYEADYLGGLNAGMKAIFFNHKGKHKVRKDDNVVEQLTELPAKIPWVLRP